jgi:cytochrome c-type biogenesis protein CcmH/NrfG
MNRESLVFAISGVFFGLLAGWILGSQRTQTVRSPAPASQASAQTPAAASDAPRQMDESRVQALRAAAQQNPKDVASRTELGNLYFDANRFDEAVRWYEESLRLDPGNPNVSTDLGVSYYYLNDPDRALAQFDKSLALDPAHTKTMLNVGIVRAYGKQDLAGAAAAWEQVLKISPNSPEGQAARQALESLRAAHPNTPSGG